MFNHDLPSNPHVEKQRREVIIAVEKAIAADDAYITFKERIHPSILTMLRRGNYLVFDDPVEESIHVELKQGSLKDQPSWSR